MTKDGNTGKQMLTIFSENAVPMVDELRKYISDLDSFCKDILEIEMAMWNLNITTPPIILDNFNKLIDIFDKLHNKEDEYSKRIREVLQDVFIQNLLFIHTALEISNHEQHRQDLEFFKKSIPLVKKTITILAASNNCPAHERMMKIIEELGNNINESFVDELGALIAQYKTNHDFEDIVEEIIEKVHHNRSIIGNSKRIDETISDYAHWLEKKKKKSRIFWNIAMSIAGGLALIGLGSKMRK